MKKIEYGQLSVRIAFPALSDLSFDPVEVPGTCGNRLSKPQVPSAITAVKPIT